MLRRLRKRKDEPSKPVKHQALVLPMHSASRSLEFLTEFIDKIRPDKPKDFNQAEVKFKALLYQVSNDKSSLFSLRKALLSQFLKAQIVAALTESGIVSSRGFVQELMTKLKHKFFTFGSSASSQHHAV